MGDNKESVRKVAWVKLGSVWWPGKLLNEDELTEEMKADVELEKSKKKDNIHVVKFFNEDDYSIVSIPSQIQIDITGDKKLDIIKRALTTMKAPSSSLSSKKEHFKKDVLDAERYLNPSADLTDLQKVLAGETLQPKRTSSSNKYADIFPSPKPEKPVLTTPLSAGKGKGVKFNFPSSRIINVASSKSPSKIAPLPSDPSKKYHCSRCQFSSERVNVITTHMKYCSGPVAAPGRKSAKPAVSPAPAALAISPKKSPVVKKESPKQTPARKPGRPTKKSLSVEPAAVSPVAAAATVTPASPVKSVTPTLPVAATSPKKRGRRSKKDKQLSDKQKAEILQDWNDSSSEENDSDDELAPLMPPTKPPELFLFGSEKNKKRKSEVVPEEEKIENGEAKTEVAGGPANEDQPPVLKKPRTDKELSDAFDTLMQKTKPEFKGLLDQDEMDVDEDDHKLSDIEEDAMIVMKKSDEADVDMETETKLEDGNKEDDEKETEKKVEEEVVKEQVVEEETAEPVEKQEEAPKKVEEKKTKETKVEEKSTPVPTRRSSRRGGGAGREPTPEPVVVTPVPEKQTGSRRGRRGSKAEKEPETKVEAVEPEVKPQTRKEALEAKKKKVEEEKKIIAESKRVELEKQEEEKIKDSQDKVVEEKKVEEPEKKPEDVEPKKKQEKVEPEKNKESDKVAVVAESKEEKSIPEIKEVVESKKEKETSAKIFVEEKKKEPVVVPEMTKKTEKVVLEKPVSPVKAVVQQQEVKKVEVKAAPINAAALEKSPVKAPTPVQASPVKAPTQVSPTKVPTPVQTSPAKSPAKPQPAKVETKEVSPVKPVASPKKTVAAPPSAPAPPSPVKTVTNAKASSPVTTAPPIEEAHKVAVSSAPVQSVPKPVPSSPTKTATPTKPNTRTPSPPKIVPKETPATLPPVSATVIPTQKKSPKKAEQTEKRIVPEPSKTVSAVQPPPPVVAPVPPVAAATPPPPPQTLAPSVPPPPPPVTAAPKQSLPQPPQKKPTAAVRPLVDNKEPPTPIPPPAPVKEVNNKAAVPPTQQQKAIPKETQQQQPPTAPATATAEDPSADSKEKQPGLVAQRVVHLVPVENQDGSITYMLLSLENGADNPAVVVEQGEVGGDQQGTVLRLDKVAATPGTESTNNAPLNPGEVEGIFLDKGVDNANQIVSALAAQHASDTATSVMDTATTAYVTLAVDPTTGGMALASGSDATLAAGSATQSIVLPEGATTAVAQEGGGDQQVFYMTEDGSLIDPQSLGLTFEQLQQLLNQ